MFPESVAGIPGMNLRFRLETRKAISLSCTTDSCTTRDYQPESGVTPAVLEGLKWRGIQNLIIDQLVILGIHGIN
jgi:hypothetical protein